ncbi:hypothetical protein EKM02_01910 [Flavobacterium sp. RSP49]|uniref:hypothetical protein n=1 Tax=Flavobacterium sp. RSP49 TaxID=2497487 RepID=UPI000F83DE29|nr:hypothetical protein [Flavobacterium sp. RSP49]RTZ02828.1 hypothetical protein EKM02_01910 [Flavobacterium sp. RSP49]
MKKSFVFLLILVVSYSYSQSVNDYKAVIIPVKYDFLKTENQYRLTTMSKFNLNKAGFEAFYSNEAIPSDYNDRCSLLYMDVVKENAFLMTKLFVTLKDCYGKIIFQSAVGKSKEKQYETAYGEALNYAFESVNELQYKYNGTTKTTMEPEVTKPLTAPVVLAQKVVSASVSDEKEMDLLYAQPTATGFQLIDSSPKVVMKVFKTSSAESFIALKGDIKGVLIAKNNQWFFEYYENDKLYSEKIAVKF